MGSSIVKGVRLRLRLRLRLGRRVVVRMGSTVLVVLRGAGEDVLDEAAG